jgi:hypothetical protein
LTGGYDAAMLDVQKDFAMTQTAPHPAGFDFAATLRAGLALFLQVMIGMMLVLTAGIVAVMTAIAGVLLGTTALVMRFAGSRRVRRQTGETGKEPMTLEARRTPRGWTVE